MERVKQLLSLANVHPLWLELLLALELGISDRTLPRLEALASWRKTGPKRTDDAIAFAVVSAIAYAKLCMDEAIATGRKPVTLGHVIVHWAGDADTEAEAAIGELDVELLDQRAPCIADHNWSNLYDELEQALPRESPEARAPSSAKKKSKKKTARRK